MHAAIARCSRYCEESLLPLPPLQAAGGGEGWPHVLLVVVRMDGDDNRNGDCLSRRGVGQEKRTGGIERWVCFSCCLISLLFFGLPFSMQVN